MIIRIERLPTPEENEELLKQFRIIPLKNIPNFLKITDKDKEEHLFWKIVPPKLRVEEHLVQIDVEVDELTFNELLAIFREFRIPCEPIENGIKITYLSEEGLDELGLYKDENGEIKELNGNQR